MFGHHLFIVLLQMLELCKFYSHVHFICTECPKGQRATASFWRSRKLLDTDGNA